MKKGFTLIELLIVVAIIGIIAAIAIPQLIDYIQRARCERTEGDARNIALALGAYYNDFDEFPSGNFASMESCLEPDYLVNVPDRDGWNAVWIYTTSSAGGAPDQHYSITSYARNGASGPIGLKDDINPNDPQRHDYDVIIFSGNFSSNCR